MKRKNRKNHKKIEYMIYKGDLGEISKEFDKCVRQNRVFHPEELDGVIYHSKDEVMEKLIKNDIPLYVVEFHTGSWTCFESKENFIKKTQEGE